MTATAADVLVAGASARALAEAARRAGYLVAAVDAYGDLDLRQAVGARWQPCIPWDAGAAARLTRDVPAGAVAYTANLENHPSALRALARGRELLGNGPAVLRRARDPRTLARVLRRAGLPAPAARFTAPAGGGGAWLLKPRASGGGQRIRRWRRGVLVTREFYLQEWVAGVPGSLLFLADGTSAAPVLLTRQLVGDARFGARGYRWCGNLAATRDAPLFDRQEAVFASAVAAAEALVAATGLVGLNGVDFVVRDGTAHVVEVNPRWTAAAELAGRALALPLFEHHVRACRGALLPVTPDPLGARAVHGKAVVFAVRRGAACGTAAWLGDPGFADIPADGTPVARGAPVCTVLGEGADAARCLERLAALATEAQHALVARRRVPA